MIEQFEKAFDAFETRLPFMHALLEAWMDDGFLEEFLAVRLRRISESLQAFVTKRVASGVLRPIDPLIGARLAMGVFAGLIAPSLRGVEPLPSRQERHILTETIVAILLDGVRTRKV